MSASGAGAGASILRNVAIVSFAGYLESAVGLIVGVVIARALGPEDFGRYAFVVWVCGWLIMAGNNALTGSSIKFLAEARGAEKPELAAALLHRFKRLQIASSLTVLTIFAAVVLWRPTSEWRESLAIMLPAAIVAVWARAGFLMLGAIGKGYERFEPEAVALAVAALVNLGLVLLLTFSGAGPEAYFVLYAATGVLSNLVVRWGLKRHGIRGAAGPIPPDFSQRVNRHIGLTAVLVLLGLCTNRTVEMLLLKAYANIQTVGYFAIAGTLTKGAVDLLAGGLAYVLLPAMARAYGSGGRDSLARMLADSTRVYWSIGLAIAGGGITVAAGAIHLFYGSRYDAAIPALMWNLVIAGLLITNSATAAVLTAGDRQLDRIGVGVVALLFNVAAGVVLIPRFGLNGAIASMALTKSVEFCFAWWFASRRVAVKLPFAPMARATLAAVLATLAGSAVSAGVPNQLAFVAGGCTFVAVYLALHVLLRVARRSDYQALAAVLAKAGGAGRRIAGRLQHLGDRFGYVD